jgi:hypothetical protein
MATTPDIDKHLVHPNVESRPGEPRMGRIAGGSLGCGCTAAIRRYIPRESASKSAVAAGPDKARVGV